MDGRRAEEVLRPGSPTGQRGRSTIAMHRWVGGSIPITMSAPRHSKAHRGYGSKGGASKRADSEANQPAQTTLLSLGGIDPIEQCILLALAHLHPYLERREYRISSRHRRSPSRIAIIVKGCRASALHGPLKPRFQVQRGRLPVATFARHPKLPGTLRMQRSLAIAKIVSWEGKQWSGTRGLGMG